VFSDRLQKKIDNAKSYKRPLTINGITFSSPLLLAPMAGVTNRPFRKLMYQLGIGGAVTELISSHGISFKSKKTIKMLTLDATENNTGIQLFGEDPDLLNGVAKFCEHLSRPTFIDINMGCPVRKIIKRGAGSALLNNQNLYLFFIRVKKDLKTPLTIKIRKAFDEDNTEKIVEMAKDAGISFVTIHGRTAKQMYLGENDWPYVEKIAEKSQIPIIGNGDLTDANQIKEMIFNTNCRALMIGRGALYNPFIFLESYSNINFTGDDRLEVLMALYGLFKEEKLPLVIFKRHAVWMAKGMPEASIFRNSVFTSSEDALLKLIYDFFRGY
jgi:nifR3 family TIM-barrel protein